MKVSVILPTYNEVQNISRLLSILCDVLFILDFEIIVVDDNSPDGTYLVAHNLAKKLYQEHRYDIKVFKRNIKSGLGSAYKFAMNFVTGDYVIIMDSDLSHSPQNILDFLDHQVDTNADIVCGSRYIKGGKIQGLTKFRYFISSTANYLTRFFLKTKLTDLTNSYRLYRREVISNLIKYIESDGYSFQMEILIKAEKLKYKIKDYPITFYKRTSGYSKLNIIEIIKYIYRIFILCFYKF